MSENLSYLVEEMKNIYPHLQYLRKSEGIIEFGLKTSYGIQWFPYHRLPVRAEQYINKLIMMGQL